MIGKARNSNQIVFSIGLNPIYVYQFPDFLYMNEGVCLLRVPFLGHASPATTARGTGSSARWAPPGGSSSGPLWGAWAPAGAWNWGWLELTMGYWNSQQVCGRDCRVVIFCLAPCTPVALGYHVRLLTEWVFHLFLGDPTFQFGLCLGNAVGGPPRDGPRKALLRCGSLQPRGLLQPGVGHGGPSA